MENRRFRKGHWAILAAVGFAVAAGGAHYALNVRPTSRRTGDVVDQQRLGYIPVTCHLTCPVTDYIAQQKDGRSPFKPLRFSGWPELKESFISGKIGATFLLAPLAISLRESGVPIKIVYLGHRDGTAMMVHRESAIKTVADLRGKRIAVPSRFSNQYLLLFRALSQAGIPREDVKMVEMPPPDMPAALHARAVDAITSGEPFMGQTELDGYGRVLYQARDVWPDFISCVLAVREDLIASRRADIQEMVDGIARSGKWLEAGMENRMQASEFVSKNYYNQNPRLLRHVLSKPPDRVRYTNLALFRKDFELIERVGKEVGTLKGTAHFDDYADTSFVKSDTTLQAWDWKAP